MGEGASLTTESNESEARSAYAGDGEPAATRRERRVRIATASDVVNKAVSTLSRIVTVPLTLSYLGRDGYGAWLAIGSVVGWLQLPTGFTLGIVNTVGAAHAKGDTERGREAVATAMLLVGCMFAVIAAAMIGAYLWGVPLERLAAIPSASPAAMDVRSAVVLVGVAAGLAQVIGVANNVAVAHQEGYLVSGSGTLQSIVSMLTMVALVWWSKCSYRVSAIAAANVGPTVLFGVGFIAYVLKGRYAYLAPAWGAVTGRAARQLCATGLPLIIAQVSEFAYLMGPTAILAHRLGPAALPPWAITWSAFNAVLGVLNALIGPLWPAYSDAVARADWKWVENKHRRSLTLVVGAMGSFAGAMVVIGPWVVRLWAGASVVPSRPLVAAIGCYAVLLVAGATSHALLRGVGLFAWYRWSAPLSALACTGGTYLLAGRIGTLAAPIACAAASGADAVLTYWVAHRELRRLRASDEGHRR